MAARKTVGEVLQNARLQAGLSIRDLEKITGISTGHISRIESGVREDPSFSTIERLAEGIGISLDELSLGIRGRITKPRTSSQTKKRQAILKATDEIKAHIAEIVELVKTAEP